MITHYQGSRGPMEIATMPGPYAKNAHAKLVREQIGNARQDEIDALAARVATWEAEEAARAEDGAS